MKGPLVHYVGCVPGCVKQWARKPVFVVVLYLKQQKTTDLNDDNDNEEFLISVHLLGAKPPVLKTLCRPWEYVRIEIYSSWIRGEY